MAAVLGTVAMLAASGGLAAAAAPKGVLTSCTTGATATAAAWDPVTHRMYVTNAGAGTISLLKGTCTVSAKITTPSLSTPYGIAFDPSNNYVYATDFYLNQVYVISGTTVIATITGFSEPAGIAYDPGDGVMVVANYGGNTVSLISGTSLSSSVAVGSFPIAVAYDPYFSVVLVTNVLSDNVTLLNATYPFLATGHGSAPTGSDPYAVAYDPANDADYVANYGSDNVTVMYGNGYVVGSVRVATGPWGVAFSPAALSMYVANGGSNSVWVISGLSVTHKDKLGGTSAPRGLGYDDLNDDMYATGYNSGKTYVLS